ncbi:Fic/DOC family N-terminal domain-containing protein [Massilia genomosp. 1]|uniref:Fic/DOC N-terminal domain-containing protein n=1 Tax=Massilia genomosp. 1 TaxID=2609280 RepID=A0ABX0MJ15_9BURK|nr:Fic/DOC family N-terminal domain-containing protein [Massilia genomosp. 1]NHZ62037.1 hypothetical protein [Massilia genomosp. 1]
MPFDRNKPFNDLPLLPPPAKLETKAVLKQTIAARAALADLKGAARQLPNQGVLIQALGLQEAKLSSEIENIVTTNDALFQGFANGGEGADAQTKEVLHYKDALWQGFQWVKAEMPINEEFFNILTR